MKKILLGFFMGLVAAPLVDHLYNLVNSYSNRHCVKLNIETDAMLVSAQDSKSKPPQMGFEVPQYEDCEEEEYEDD